MQRRILPLLLLLSQNNGADGFSTLNPTAVIYPSQRTTTSTRQYAFFGHKDKARSTEKTATVRTGEKTTINQSNRNFFNRKATERMPPVELELDLEKEETEMARTLAGVEFSLEKLLVPLAVSAFVAGAAMTASSTGLSIADISSQLQAFQADPQGTLQSSLDGLGPMAVVYFGALYITAELLAIPATPLTLTAGYLFGLTQGTLVVLAAGTISAMIGFGIGKTFLRSWVETVLEENPKFRKLDTAIGAEGFKLLVLIRLSPIFPFALLNYTYGASSISFPTFVAGTLVGFTPSTFGYVYTGLVGKELLLGEGSQPWYVYAAGVTALFGFLKLVTDVATQVVEAIDEE